MSTPHSVSHPSSCPGAIPHGSDPRDPDSIELCGHTPVTSIRTVEDARRYLAERVESGALCLQLDGDIVVTERFCPRCGGAGGAAQWAHTGWTCYKCGGLKPRWTDRTSIKAYAQRERRRQIARGGRAAKREASREQRAAAEAQREEQRLERQRDWSEQNGHGRITFAELDVKRAAEREAQKAASSHVGTIGERREFSCRVVFKTSFDTQFGVTFVTVMVDDAGNKIVQKGTSLGASDANGFRVWADKGDRVVFAATVKEHGSRDGERQTVVCRPRVKSIESSPKAEKEAA